MRPRRVFPAILILMAVLAGAKDWKNKPASEWTSSDVDEILTDSPWVYRSSTAFAIPDLGEGRHPVDPFRPGGHVHRSSGRYPIIRILSAKPIRDALLLRLLATTREAAVSIGRLENEGPGDSRSAREGRLQRFAKNHPKDLRVMGDADYIVFAVTMRQVIQTDSGIAVQEVAFPISELERMPTSGIVLVTGKGKGIPLARYEPPQKDELGAKLYFPRVLPDGRSSVVRDDHEIQVEISIAGKRIKALFKLENMFYKDRLEI